MAGFNLPPGCSVNDIPGNRPEDDEMSDREWNMLAILIDKSTNLPNLTATERGILIRRELESRGCEQLDEFVAELQDSI